MNFENDTSLKKIDMAFYRNSFVTGKNNESRIKMQYYFRKDDGHLFADIWVGPDAEGPPDFAHGGAMAAILDEGMGFMGWFNHYPVVTVNLSVDYKNSLPLGHNAYMEAWIERTEGRKVFAYGEIHSEDGSVYASAKGVFVCLPVEAFADRWHVIQPFYEFPEDFVSPS